MLLSCSNQKLMNMVKNAYLTSGHSVQCLQPNQFIHCRDIEAKTWIANCRRRASLRRVLLFQMLPAFGTIFCRGPILVDGLAIANEKRSNWLSDPSKFPSDVIVLQGLPYTAKLERPSTSPQILQLDYELEEVLSVKLKLLRRKASAFHIFINLPDANEQTPVTIPEFGGLYFHEPRRVKSPDFEFQVVTFRTGIGEIIRDLGLGDRSSILVTFVPCGADKGLPIVLEQMEVELE